MPIDMRSMLFSALLHRSLRGIVLALGVCASLLFTVLVVQMYAFNTSSVPLSVHLSLCSVPGYFGVATILHGVSRNPAAQITLALLSALFAFLMMSSATFSTVWFLAHRAIMCFTLVFGIHAALELSRFSRARSAEPLSTNDFR